MFPVSCVPLLLRLMTVFYCTICFNIFPNKNLNSLNFSSSFFWVITTENFLKFSENLFRSKNAIQKLSLIFYPVVLSETAAFLDLIMYTVTGTSIFIFNGILCWVQWFWVCFFQYSISQYFQSLLSVIPCISLLLIITFHVSETMQVIRISVLLALFLLAFFSSYCHWRLNLIQGYV